MITHINCLKGVGKFQNCTAGGITLTNKVLIFGHNTNGKSTLTSILMSLKDKNNNLILGRKTFGYTGDQNIVIKTDNKTFTFQNNSWNEGLPQLEIFDTKFITNNVCNTEDISFQQQQNLNGVILGETGKAILIEIQAITNDINQIAIKKREITTYFTSIIKKDISLEKFFSLTEKQDVDSKINEKKLEIEQLKNKIVLLKKIEASFFRFDCTQIEEKINKNISLNFKDIEKHLNKHSINSPAGKKFIHDGINLNSSDSCIFCGQEFDETAKLLTKAYAEVFTKDVSALQKQINDVVDNFNSINFKDKLENSKFELEALGIKLNLSEDRIREISESKERFTQTLKTKKSDLTINIDFQQNVDWNLIKHFFNEMTLILEKEKNAINEPKNIDELNKEIIILELTKKRYETEITEKISEYKRLDENTLTLQNEREGKNKELEDYAIEIFQKYRTKINTYLADLNATFTLDDFSHLKKIKGQDEFVFTINFESAPKISPYGCEDGKPCFRNTLSESDKRTLAFAFFLAKLSLDPELDNKIIVFDDPISSFDSERKRKTCHLLLDINFEGKKPKQMIILTHQEDFLKDLVRDLDRFKENHTLLKILPGTIELIRDIDQEFPNDEIIYLLSKIKRILEEEKFEIDFQTDCRKIIEHIMKRKYYSKLDEINRENPRASIRTYADEVYDKENQDYKNFIRLCDDLQIPLHDNSIPESSNGDKKSTLQDFFKVLEKI